MPLSLPTEPKGLPANNTIYIKRNDNIMKTQLLNENQIAIAAEIIKKGGLVALPTETVYGLGADALNGEAVASIFAAKGRPMDNPLIVHISDISQLYPLVREFPEKAKRLAEKYWPGPLTMIMKKSDIIPNEVSAGLDTVAIRFPSHPVAQKLITLSKTPIAAPSANISGHPSPTSFEHVKADMFGKIDAIIDGGACSVGLESTVITLAGEKPRLLRPGGITLEQLESVIGEVEVDRAVFDKPNDNEKVASPGMKYKHYAPNAKVIILNGNTAAYIDYVNSKAQDGVCALCYTEDVAKLKVPCVSYGSMDDFSQQAQNLFDALRELDKIGARLVFARCPSIDGVGMAVYNRLIRAAGFEVIDI